MAAPQKGGVKKAHAHSQKDGNSKRVWRDDERYTDGAMHAAMMSLADKLLAMRQLRDTITNICPSTDIGVTADAQSTKENEANSVGAELEEDVVAERNLHGCRQRCCGLGCTVARKARHAPHCACRQPCVPPLLAVCRARHPLKELQGGAERSGKKPQKADDNGKTQRQQQKKRRQTQKQRKTTRKVMDKKKTHLR